MIRAGILTSLVTFNVTAGTTYQIAVDGFKGASGNVVLGMPSGTAYRVLTPSCGSSVPVITNQPTNQLVFAGANVTLRVGASNALTYQWFFQGAPVGVGGTAATWSSPTSRPGRLASTTCWWPTRPGRWKASRPACKLSRPTRLGREAWRTQVWRRGGFGGVEQQTLGVA